MPDLPARLTVALSDRYRIESEIGSGGMATVYLAQDLKHDRKVAVKVLKSELAAVLGADRFLTEIKTTANLQHPHILPLHDSGEADGFLFYVMPFVGGESLRAKLDREKQLSVDEAVRIAGSVAKALDYAHRHGVIHRDIKPANILLHDGQPMLADFGIALAVRAAGGPRLTETGLSLGTPQYMSPEQASGDREVDGRSDIYSLGAVLYEMLTGEAPHTGPTVQAIIAKLLADKPRPVTELRETVPVHVAAAVHKALAKLPADRFEGAGEMASVLDGRRPSDLLGPSGSSASGPHLEHHPLFRAIPWALVVVLLALLSVQRLGESRVGREGEPWYANLILPDSAPMVFVGEAWAGIPSPGLDISPNGKHVVYVGQAEGTTALFVRSLDSFRTWRLQGTEGAESPFFSPDGAWVGFVAENTIFRVSLDGSSRDALGEAMQPYGTVWREDGTILSLTNDGKSILTVGPTGSNPRIVPAEGKHGSFLADPEDLPGMEWFLATCYMPYRLCAVSAETSEMRTLVSSGEAGDPDGDPLRGTNPRFLAPEYLLFSDPARNRVMGVRFDPSRLSVLSDPVEVLPDVRRETGHGALQLSISETGDLVYAHGADALRAHLVWAGPGEERDTLPFDSSIYGPFYLSPDGTKIAAHVTSETGRFELQLLDLERSSSHTWIPDRPSDVEAVYYGAWLPDSRSVVVTVAYGDASELVAVDAVQPEGGTTLWRGTGMVTIQSLPSDSLGLLTVYREGTSYTSHFDPRSWDRLPGRADAAFPPSPSLPNANYFPRPSPDGEWIIYNSDSGGPWELWAHKVGSEDRDVPISTEGADIGSWTVQGNSLYFRDGQAFFRVDRTEDPEHPFSQPSFYLEGDFLNVSGPDLGVHPDGRRLLLLEGPPQRTTRSLNLIQNWRSVLGDRLGGEG